MAQGKCNAVELLGRILLSAIFIISGIMKIGMFSGIAGALASKHMPLPAVGAAIAIAIEILGGLAILTGIGARAGAWLLFLYLIPTTLLFHNFWAFQGAARADNQAHFLKNLAIMGGLLLVAAHGAICCAKSAGGSSIDQARAAKQAV